MILREQVGTGLGELHERPALMLPSQPRSMASARPAPNSAGLPPWLKRNGPLSSSM